MGEMFNQRKYWVLSYDRRLGLIECSCCAACRTLRCTNNNDTTFTNATKANGVSPSHCL